MFFAGMHRQRVCARNNLSMPFDIGTISLSGAH